jgi:hypothetical protein
VPEFVPGGFVRTIATPMRMDSVLHGYYTQTGSVFDDAIFNVQEEEDAGNGVALSWKTVWDNMASVARTTMERILIKAGDKVGECLRQRSNDAPSVKPHDFLSKAMHYVPYLYFCHQLRLPHIPPTAWLTLPLCLIR